MMHFWCMFGVVIKKNMIKHQKPIEIYEKCTKNTAKMHQKCTHSCIFGAFFHRCKAKEAALAVHTAHLTWTMPLCKHYKNWCPCIWTPISSPIWGLLYAPGHVCGSLLPQFPGQTSQAALRFQSHMFQIQSIYISAPTPEEVECFHPAHRAIMMHHVPFRWLFLFYFCFQVTI